MSADWSNTRYWTSNLPKSHPRRYILRHLGWPEAADHRPFRVPRAAASGFQPIAASVRPWIPERCAGLSRPPVFSFADCIRVVSFWSVAGVSKRPKPDRGVEIEVVVDERISAFRISGGHGWQKKKKKPGRKILSTKRATATSLSRFGLPGDERERIAVSRALLRRLQDTALSFSGVLMGNVVVILVLTNKMLMERAVNRQLFRFFTNFLIRF